MHAFLLIEKEFLTWGGLICAVTGISCRLSIHGITGLINDAWLIWLYLALHIMMTSSHSIVSWHCHILSLHVETLMLSPPKSNSILLFDDSINTPVFSFLNSLFLLDIVRWYCDLLESLLLENALNVEKTFALDPTRGCPAPRCRT